MEKLLGLGEEDKLFDKVNKTRQNLPKFDWEKSKMDVLGSKYELSLIFCGDTLSKKLNNQYRSKNKPTNILSFPLSPTSGEIFINIPLASKEAKKLGYKKSQWIPYLYIHGLLHLKGLDHGKKMDDQEMKFIKKYRLNVHK